MRGRTGKHRSRFGRGFALVAVAVVAVQTAAFASHYRYGSNSWKPTSDPNTVQFQIAEAWRRSSFSGTGSDGMPVPGDVVSSDNVIEWGDGTSTGFDLLITSIDADDDWMFGIALDPDRPAGDESDTQVDHTYPSSGNFLMATTGCCRVGQTSTNWHVNNPDEGQRVESLVNVGGGNASPVSTLPPIVQCPVNGICEFDIPASDPDGDNLRYRFSTPAEAGSAGYNQPGPPEAPNAATVDPTTGEYRWDTSGATLGPSGSNTLYSSQVTIEDVAANGSVKSKIAVDFLIELSAAQGNSPRFDHPPSPPCSSTLAAPVGQELQFTVRASDVDAGDQVNLNAAGLPAGSTMTPSLPESGNPVQSTFEWTPTSNQTGTHVVTFSATDPSGNQALCSYTLEVAQAASQADLSLTKSDSPDPVTEEQALTYTLTVRNNGPDGATGVVVEDQLPSSAAFVSATPSQGSCSANRQTVTCNVGAMSNGAVVTIEIEVTPSTPGTITNQASVESSNDPSLGNNSDSENTTVEAANRLPDCSSVTASPSELWPPNHKFHDVRLTGATDPDGDAITYEILTVTQDEPVNEKGDGNTSPDARRTSSADTIQVRAERSGGGDGRVYRIVYVVQDVHGRTCSGTAMVSVPHDQSGPPAVDSGGEYNSFGEE